ncbi:hypothetical protein BC332_00855 [Capsicum chinense]|nr:hypothetical protein BC332_00855 [Capsicum chinense]
MDGRGRGMDGRGFKFAENWSKHRNDPVTMKKLRDKAASKSKKSSSKAASKKKFDDSGRPRLPKGLKYRIDKVPLHSLHKGSLCNRAFGEEIKKYFGEDVLGAFRNMIFGIFLNLSQCNWIGQISKCLHMLTIQQDNKDELHVWVQGEILKFTMLEFVIIIGLKCTDNIDDYMYTSSSKSALISKYFSDNKGAITKLKLITSVKMGNFDNFEDDFEIFDPITSTSTFVAGALKRTTDEFQQRVGTIAEEFDDFMEKKDCDVQQDSPAIMDDDTSTRDHPVHHVSDLYRGMQKDATDKGEIGGTEFEHHQQGEISVSTERHQHKSVPSSSTQPEGTSNSSLDGDQIKNYINKYYAEKMVELVRLISKIPAEVIKALKNKENKQSEEEKIVDQQQSQEDKFKKHDSPYKEDIQDVNAIDKEAGHEDDLKNEDCSALKALEDVNVTTKEDGHDENLKKQECTDMEDVQVIIDIILFGLSTPSTIKSLDIGDSYKMTESQWDLPDSQISPDFLDAQVQELEATKAKAPTKRERKKSRILRSPYITKYGSGSKDAGDFDKQEKLKYAFDGYTINQDFPNELMIDYSQ